MTDDRAPLRALVEKWKDEAAAAKTDAINTFSPSVRAKFALKARAMWHCADELSAALSAAPAAGWQDISTAPEREWVLVPNETGGEAQPVEVLMKWKGKWHDQYGHAFKKPSAWMPAPPLAGPEPSEEK